MNRTGDNNRLSARQKMINLMYLVLTAMLALYISSDMLDGFGKVDENLRKTNQTAQLQNENMLAELDKYNSINPIKTSLSHQQALKLRTASLKLFAEIDSIKKEIISQADGNLNHYPSIMNRDNVLASQKVLLSAGENRGMVLINDISAYCCLLREVVSDSSVVASALSALPTIATNNEMNNWVEMNFNGRPAVASLALLSKLQADVLFAEKTSLDYLKEKVDASDLRVNELQAIVVPESRIVMKGSTFSAKIALASVDTTLRPRIYVDNKLIPKWKEGLYETSATKLGRNIISGVIEIVDSKGTLLNRKFTTEFDVVEPVATVAASMMKVLYAGVDNPIEITLPGVSPEDITAEMTNGKLTRKGNIWNAKPNNANEEARLIVYAAMGSSQRKISETRFHVRELPQPTPYIAIEKNGRYRGGTSIRKNSLLAAETLNAAIDDGILDVAYRVVSFETLLFDSMGNVNTEVSNGEYFSQRQKEQIRKNQRGKRFFLTNIKAVGPDGKIRALSPMEIIIN